MQSSYSRALMPRLARRAGIDGRVHCHGLRHFFAASLAQARCPIVHVQAALGHANLGTTSRYLSRIAPKDSAEAVTAAFARMLGE
jgi:integrase